MCEAYLRGRQGQQLRVSVVAVPLVWESSAAPAAGLPSAAALGHDFPDRWPRWVRTPAAPGPGKLFTRFSVEGACDSSCCFALLR